MQVIDVHGHFGICNNHNYDLNDMFMSGDIDTVRCRAARCDIKMTFISALSSLMPHGGNPLGGNQETIYLLDHYPDIKFWLVLNPKIPECFNQIQLSLQTKRSEYIAGIKIHPTLHEYDIEKYGDIIGSFAIRHDLIVLTHTGCGTPPEKIALLANKYKSVKIIMAHLGSSDTGELTRQVNAFKSAKSDNLYIDTSSGCSIYSGLLEWSVNEIGSTNILFGSDTPLHHVGMQKARVELADISDSNKENILFKNAERLFNIHL